MVSNAKTMRSTSRSGSPTSFALVLAVAAVGCGHGGPARPTGAPADLVVLGGDVRTGDPARPHATAIAIRGGEIVAVGADGELRGLIGDTTQVLQLAGQTVTPGL